LGKINLFLRSPINKASAGGCLDIVKFLVMKGADINDKDIKNPLFCMD